MQQSKRFEGSCSHRVACLRIFGRVDVRYSIALSTRPSFDIVKVHNLSFTTMSILDCNHGQ
jgi:hypothetical protein